MFCGETIIPKGLGGSQLSFKFTIRPEEYGEKDFFLLIHEKRRNNLIKELAKTTFQITDADKQEFYQRAKQEKAAFLLDNGKYRSYDSVESLLEEIIADQRYQKYLDQELKTTVV